MIHKSVGHPREDGGGLQVVVGGGGGHRRVEMLTRQKKADQRSL
jgi:hypothetical protein